MTKRGPLVRKWMIQMWAKAMHNMNAMLTDLLLEMAMESSPL